MASAETRLPAISVIPSRGESVERKEPETKDTTEDKLTNASSFLARFRLGAVQKEPRPGDVYKQPQRRPCTTSAAQPRPLGLLPDRGARISVLKELTQLLSPRPAHGPASAPADVLLRGGDEGLSFDRNGGGRGEDRNTKSVLQDRLRDQESLISAAVNLKTRADEEEETEHRSVEENAGTKSGSSLQTERSRPPHPGGTPFRLSAAASSHPKTGSKLTATVKHLKPIGLGQDVATAQSQTTAGEPNSTLVTVEDREYVDTLAKCNIKEYGISDPQLPSDQHNSPGMRRTRTLPATGVHGLAGLLTSRYPGVSPKNKKARKVEK